MAACFLRVCECACECARAQAPRLFAGRTRTSHVPQSHRWGRCQKTPHADFLLAQGQSGGAQQGISWGHISATHVCPCGTPRTQRSYLQPCLSLYSPHGPGPSDASPRSSCLLHTHYCMCYCITCSVGHFRSRRHKSRSRLCFC